MRKLGKNRRSFFEANDQPALLLAAIADVFTARDAGRADRLHVV